MANQTLTRIQREVLASIKSLTLQDGCPPVAARIKRAMGRDIRGPLEELKKLGFVHQPYPRGAFVIVKEVDGTELQLTILPKDIAQEAESKAYRRK